MLWAAFTISFFGFLRAGVLCMETDGMFDPEKHLTTQDIQIDNIHNPQLLKVHFKQSKMDQFRVGADVFVAWMRSQLCPVLALFAWLVRRGTNEPGPLFFFQSGAPLTRSTFVIRLKQALSYAGIDPTWCTAHSFRSGAATVAAKRGLWDSAIKQLGTWKSTTYQRYIKPSTTLGTLASSISTTQVATGSSNPWEQQVHRVVLNSTILFNWLLAILLILSQWIS